MRQIRPVTIVLTLVVTLLSFVMALAVDESEGSGFAPLGEEIEIFQPVASFTGGAAYGFSVDIGGDIAVVGDSRGGVDGVAHAGVAHVYERDEATGSWTEITQLHAPSPHECAHFGAAVAVTEEADTIIVGEEGRRDHSACKQDGSIYFFHRDEGGVDNWGLIKTIDGSGAFGNPLRVDGGTLVVGMPGDYGNSTCSNASEERPDDPAGAVQIYQRDAGGIDAWGLVETIDPPHDSPYDRYFGCAVAIGGNRLAVGAPDFGEMGMAYLYDGEAGWAMTGSFAGLQRWNTLGFAVAVSAEDFIIGAPWEWAPNLRDHLGQVYPGETTPLPYPMPVNDGHYLVGMSLALDGDLLAVSYDLASETINTEDVLIYRRTPQNEWELVQVLEGVGPECASNMSIAMDGNSLIVGETNCPGGMSAHIFERTADGGLYKAFLPLAIR